MTCRTDLLGKASGLLQQENLGGKKLLLTGSKFLTSFHTREIRRKAIQAPKGNDVIDVGWREGNE